MFEFMAQLVLTVAGGWIVELLKRLNEQRPPLS